MRTIIPIRTLSKDEILRFWSKVAITANPDKCWEWQAGRRRQVGRWGHYGTCYIDTRQFAAHRVAYSFYNQVDPGKLQVLHRCDNPPCVNPAHLFLGTQSDNMLDCFQKGRRLMPPARGHLNGNARLTKEDVEVIRRRFTKGESQTSIARDFPVGQPTISAIVLGKRWKET